MAGFNSTIPFQPGRAAMPTVLVELSISCRKLRNRDTLSLSDPMCVIYSKDNNLSNKSHEIARTEMIKNCLNPDFLNKLNLEYCFEVHQKLKFKVYDSDSSVKDLWAHDFLGEMDCSLGEIIACQGRQFKKKLTYPGGDAGEIHIVAEEIIANKEVAKMRFAAKNLDRKDFLGKSDPFLEFYKSFEDGSFSAVHKTEVIKNNLNPTWKPVTISVRSLCNGDYHRPIKVQCFDWDDNGTSNDFIGEFTTNLNELLQGQRREFPCINHKKEKKKSGYKNSGIVSLLEISIEQKPSFMDFIKGGTQLNFTVAVDFTGSNGDPRDPKSLHFNNPNHPNEYIMAIRAIGEIIQDYDSDKLFPALGFGAKVPPQGKVSHEFFLSGNSTNPYCSGVEGILQAYQYALNTVQLFGPTLFAPIINHVINFARAYSGGSQYFVLLIITDGVIDDMAQTKEAIVRASSLPMSIIIVGVGDAEFDEMEVLDADRDRLSSNGKYAERDIVQFVPFRQLMNPSNWQSSQQLLAKHVLAEIPQQLLQFMETRSIKPTLVAVDIQAAQPSAPNLGELPNVTTPPL